MSARSSRSLKPSEATESTRDRPLDSTDTEALNMNEGDFGDKVPRKRKRDISNERAYRPAPNRFIARSRSLAVNSKASPRSRPTRFQELKLLRPLTGQILSGLAPIQLFELDTVPPHAWLQNVRCTSRYVTQKVWRDFMCASCSGRNGTSCHFQNIRRFLGPGPVPSNYVLVDDLTSIPCNREYRPKLCVKESPTDGPFLLGRIANTLLPVLETENAHSQRRNILRRPRERHVRPVCDGCSTTIFSGHWVCYSCAKELCLDCLQEWDDSPEMMHQFQHLNRCKRLEAHTKKQMIPYTRFASGELTSLIEHISNQSSDTAALSNSWSPPPQTSYSEGLSYASSHIDELSLASFQNHWAKGEPLLLDGFLERFRHAWDPDYFIIHFGEEKAELVDVVRREIRPSTIGHFFRGFQSGSRDSMQHLKLNDWPVVDDFAKAMPELFADFEAALPFPIYTRRKGFLNLAAWFPPYFLPPDLGPKLYCAGASSDGPGATGTTVLHMDMTDAINIMTWAGPRPTNRPGCAVWDIFQLKDSGALRNYILCKVKVENASVLMDDPIRRARYYLTTEDLVNLAAQGVHPWRIYQNPGQAVFIPAGCAHQVCNLTPCIKVACDFVSPENVHRCSTITTADRKLAALAKREDVLQLKNLVYFAYLGVSRWLRTSHVDEDYHLANDDVFTKSREEVVEDNSTSYVNSHSSESPTRTIPPLSKHKKKNNRPSTRHVSSRAEVDRGTGGFQSSRIDLPTRPFLNNSVDSGQSAAQELYASFVSAYGYERLAQMVIADNRFASFRHSTILLPQNDATLDISYTTVSKESAICPGIQESYAKVPPGSNKHPVVSPIPLVLSHNDHKRTTQMNRLSMPHRITRQSVNATLPSAPNASDCQSLTTPPWSQIGKSNLSSDNSHDIWDFEKSEVPNVATGKLWSHPRRPDRPSSSHRSELTASRAETPGTPSANPPKRRGRGRPPAMSKKINSTPEAASSTRPRSAKQQLPLRKPLSDPPTATAGSPSMKRGRGRPRKRSLAQPSNRLGVVSPPRLETSPPEITVPGVISPCSLPAKSPGRPRNNSSYRSPATDPGKPLVISPSATRGDASATASRLSSPQCSRASSPLRPETKSPKSPETVNPQTSAADPSIISGLGFSAQGVSVLPQSSVAVTLTGSISKQSTDLPADPPTSHTGSPVPQFSPDWFLRRSTRTSNKTEVYSPEVHRSRRVRTAGNEAPAIEANIKNVRTESATSRIADATSSPEVHGRPAPSPTDMPGSSADDAFERQDSMAIQPAERGMDQALGSDQLHALSTLTGVDQTNIDRTQTLANDQEGVDAGSSAEATRLSTMSTFNDTSDQAGEVRHYLDGSLNTAPQHTSLA